MNKKEKQLFLRTFVPFFIIFIVIFTLLFTAIRVLNLNPGGEDAHILAEELELDYLVDEDSPFFEAFSKDDRVNVLLLGVNGNLTDTIMLVSFNMEHPHVDIISVPRDTYYKREGYNSQAEKKLNAAYKGNPVNTAKAVSEILLGIPINYYAIVEYDGIKTIVDSMGGVPMDIPFRMKYDDPYDTPPLHIDIPEGHQVLNGEQSVQFLRFRHANKDSGFKSYPEGDMGRVKAQQQFMVNAFKQCLGFDLPKIATTVYDNLTSDMKLKTMLYFAGKASGITSEDIRTYTLPVDTDPKPPYYVYPNVGKIEEVLMEIYTIGEANSENEDTTEE